MTDKRNPARHNVYLGLGSNIGDRDANLAAALKALAEVVTVEQVSSVYDTAPMHVTSQRRFHNLVCRATTDLEADALLRAVKQIERRLGRAPGPRYGPRLIDIDLLLYDDLVLQTNQLTLPHPRLAERMFVLAPLAEIAPALVLPGLGQSVDALLQRVATSDARKVGPLPHSER